MIKVKVFVYGRRQQQQRHRGYDNSSPDFRHGELIKTNTLQNVFANFLPCGLYRAKGK